MIEGWEEKNNALHKHYEFKDFAQAWDFLSRVATLAEKLNHHPEINNVYNRVYLKLTTHSEGNMITLKDVNLAKEINNLA